MEVEMERKRIEIEAKFTLLNKEIAIKKLDECEKKN